MQPKKKLPEGSEIIAETKRIILVKHSLDKLPHYSIYEYYESSKGTRYIPRGGGSSDLDQALEQMSRITGTKIQIKIG